MNRQISFEAFVSTISHLLDADSDEVSELILELFTQIRYANIKGEWVAIEGFGRFHPLWYELRKRASRELPKAESKPLKDLAVTYTKTEPLAISYKERSLLPALIPNAPDPTSKPIDPSKEAVKQKIQDAWEETKQKHYETTHKSRQNNTVSAKKKSLFRYLAHTLYALGAPYRIKTLQNILKINQINTKRLYIVISISSGVLLLLFIISMQTDKNKDVAKLIQDADKTLKESTMLYENFKDINATKSYTSEKLYPCTIVKGDSLYSISSRLYGDSKYWPLIYNTNSQTIKDMDRIYPKDILLIPRIPKGSSAQEELAEVYIKAYQRYKELGKVEQAHWLLYWGNKHIDKSLLSKYQDGIDKEDRAQVQNYIKRFNQPAH